MLSEGWLVSLQKVTDMDKLNRSKFSEANETQILFQLSKHILQEIFTLIGKSI